MILAIIYTIFLLQDPLQFYWGISIFAWFDEALSLFCALYILLFVAKNNGKIKVSRYDCHILLLSVLWVCIGIISSVVSEYQSFQYVILDIFTCMKMYIGYFFAKSILKKGISERTRLFLAKETSFVVIVYFALTLNDMFLTPFFPILMDGGLRSIQLLYSNVTYLAAYGIVLFVMLFYTRDLQRCFLLKIGMCSAFVFLTFRSKAMGYLVVVWMIFLMIDKLNEARLRTRLLVSVPAVVVAAVMVAWDKIVIYFFTPNHFSPRSILLKESIHLASERFPLGLGYGSFCSVASIIHRSPVYDEIGYDYFSAVYDMFWGNIIGQFGFVGAACFIGTMILMYLEIRRIRVIDKNRYFMAVFGLIYLMIASLGECSFFAPYSIGYGLAIGLAFAGIGGENEKNNACE